MSVIAPSAESLLDRLDRILSWEYAHRTMNLIAADVLTEAKGLSLPFSMIGAAIGILLWLFGWRWHRFWVVFITTSLAGLSGLSGHTTVGPRMLAAGILLAVSAGMLAMELSRLFAFSAAGSTMWMISQQVLPTFQEPLIVFLIGGLAGLLLYRLQIRLLTSFVGTLIAFHSILLLIEGATSQQFEPGPWAAENSLGLDISVVFLSLFGIAVQGQLEVWLDGAADRKRSRLMSYLSETERAQLKHIPSSKPKGWFANLVGS